jgi:RNA polymerase sigma-70 factor (sigma-E family)
LANRDLEFVEFVHARGPALLRTARLLAGGDTHAAEDLLQTTLEKTYLAWRRIRVPAAREAYARTTMARLAVRWSMSRAHRSEHLVAEVPERGPDGHEDALLGRVDAAAYLRRLSPRQRAVIVLRYYDDLTEEQIADALGCSRGAVKSHSARALKRLRVHLQRELSLHGGGHGDASGH